MSVSDQGEQFVAELRRKAYALRAEATDIERIATKFENAVVLNGPPPMPFPGVALHEYARRAIRARRKIAEYFCDTLFADPARDILLDLFAAAEEGTPISVSSCCIAAAVPPTTALRWIHRLEELGILHLANDERDGRRRVVSLTPSAHAGVQAYLHSIAALTVALLEASPSHAP